MAHFHNPSILGSSGNQNLQYRISRSLRFNSADSAYLSRTPGSAGNQKTYTLSMWIKRSKLGGKYIFGAYFSNLSRYQYIGFGSSDQLEFFGGTYTTGGSTSTNVYLATTAVYRDVSAWYHIVLAVDTTQATDTNRAKLYVNGSQVTAFSSATYPSQNSESYINSVQTHYLGDWGGGASYYHDGYLADIYFLDGTATTPSTFAETDAVTGQWVPKTPTGISYGTNGFRLTFSDNSGTTSTTLGKDAAGSNNWTPNNFSVASGSGNDSLVDSPSSYGTDTGAGGEVRGNYSTLNPLSTVSDTLSNGNLDWVSGIAASRITKNTIAVSTGKWYAEFLYTGSTTNGTVVGICEVSATGNGGLPTTGYMYYQNGNKYINSTGSAYGSSWANGDLIGIALNLDSNQVTFYKNNTSQGAISITSGLTWVFCCIGSSANDKATWNFGARAFSYTAPSGFKALVDTNLTAPTIAKPANYFDVKLYTGNGGTQTISGLGFGPEFVWIKCRSASVYHALFDAVRGVHKRLGSNETSAEQDQSPSGLSAFTSDGFTVVDGATGGNGINGSPGGLYAGAGAQYVAWAWDAASSNSTNTSGTITSTVRANATAGFSIVSWTSDGTTSIKTCGHGLGVKPSLIIFKNRDLADQWGVLHSSFADQTKNWMRLNTTDAVLSSGASTYFSYDSTTFGIKQNEFFLNTNRGIAYCFAPVAGYSAFGSYTGNGSSDGPFVFCNFRPRYLMVKASSTGGSYYYWYVFDSIRDTANPTDLMLFPNVSDAESSTYDFDFLANGFKVRTNAIYVNNSAVTYIYAAFAENPFQYARAR